MSSLALGGSSYAERRRNLLTLVKELRAAGGEAELDLPRVVVIGNQSSGKSSIVEALSGISVPRDAGTCTRCPMECRMSSSSSPWSCQVLIRWEYATNGSRRGIVTETPFGLPISDPSKVELALRRAQAAVLNPALPSKKFLSQNEDSLKSLTGKTLEFSRNVICLDISGSELTDLSFIDMPGLVANAEPGVISLVEDMVISNIKGNTLILVVIPMTDDMENQKAVRLARKEDSSGRRTIGVLTKPDMLTAGASKAQELWLDVLEGRRHTLTHGYYCVRLPDDTDRDGGITAEQARKNEEDYFEISNPWSKSSSRERFGTLKMSNTLSNLLTRIINDGLPSLRAEAQRRLEDCTAELNTLPQNVEGEPLTEVLQLLAQFCVEVGRWVEGVPNAIMLQKNREAFQWFDRAIRSTAPLFVPCKRSAKDKEGWLDWLRESGDYEGTRLNEVSLIYLEDIREHIQRSLTRELPGDVPFGAKVTLMLQFQATWKDLAKTCFSEVRSVMSIVLTKCLEQIIGRFHLLHGQLLPLLNVLENKLYAVCFQHLAAIIDVQRTPFTQNTEYLICCKENWLAKYKDANFGKGKVPAAKAKVQVLSEFSTPVISRSTPKQVRDAFRSPIPTSSTSGNNTPQTTSSLRPDAAPFASEVHRFDPYTERDSGNSKVILRYQCISTMVVYRHLSQEEMRLHHYKTIGRFNSLKDNPSQAMVDGQGSEGTIFFNKRKTRATAPSHIVGEGEDDPNTAGQQKLNAALAMLAELGFSGVVEADLGKLNPPDEFEAELEVMAEVRAFFQVAYKRMIDDIPQLIDLLFVKGIARELQSFLVGELDLGSDLARERCRAWLAEDPAIATHRATLSGKKKALEALLGKLDAFGK